MVSLDITGFDGLYICGYVGGVFFDWTDFLAYKQPHKNGAIFYSRNRKYNARLIDPPTTSSVFAGGSYNYFFENPLIATIVLLCFSGGTPNAKFAV